jgi:hypothetical protein
MRIDEGDLAPRYPTKANGAASIGKVSLSFEFEAQLALP